MKRVLVVSFTLSALLTAAATAYWHYPIYRTQASVKRTLNASESAKFSHVYFKRDTGAGCGYVTVKNKMGHYVGETHFAVLPSGDVIFDPKQDTESPSQQVRINALKAKRAHIDLSLAECGKKP